MSPTSIRAIRWALRVAVAVSVLAAMPVHAQSAAAAGPAVTAADVRFMQDMIGHHQQAVEMTALVKARTRRPDLLVLSERIAVSQADEVAMMRQWLASRGAGAAVSRSAGSALHDATGHDMAGHVMGDTASAHAMMPGMLSGAQMAALRSARGRRFDRLFLEGMIQHHGGALTMVQSLLATPGAAQESSLNRFVTDVSTDQRAEITRMRRMLPRS